MQSQEPTLQAPSDHELVLYEAESRINEYQRSDNTSLDLSSIGLTSLPESLRQLTGLKTLNLHNNKLSTLPEWLGRLTELQALLLAGNYLTTLPETLSQLVGLKSLDLNKNQLNALPEWLAQLTGLQTLMLGRNKLTTLPEALSQLTGLKSLDLNNNQLTILPDWLGQMTGLQLLMLGGNQLTTLPETLSQLVGLKSLDINKNQLTVLPKWLSHLTGLKALHLNNNQLTTLPEWIGQLTSLDTLRLNGNQISTLPVSLSFLPKLSKLEVGSGMLRADLAAIWKRGGWKALCSQLQQLEVGEDVLTGKLMLVGNGKVGKSCLLDALRGVTPRHERDTTHGMVREQLHLSLYGSLIEDDARRQLPGARLDVIDFQCWDMGGQEAYWTTHQMFFTPEALYVMAYHGREGIARGQVREWLTLIRNRATSRARVLLVATHCRQVDSVTEPDLSSLDEDMRAMIVGYVAVDSFEPHGIEELRRQLAIQALGNNYFKRRMLGGWTIFQIALARTMMPFVSLEEVVKVSQQNGLSREVVLRLLQLAHDVGVVLWHHQSDEPARYVVLHPDWLSQAVAFVLKFEPAKQSNGIISHHDLSQLWATPPYPDSQGYPADVHSMLVALMEDTEISYRLPVRRGVTSQGETSLIAQLVARTPPTVWRTRWEAPMEGAHTEMVRLFSFLPPQGRKLQRLVGLAYRLIVRLHEYSLGHEDYTQAVHWQHGLLLTNDYGDLARIEFRDDDELEIRVRGLIPMSFMDRLRDTLHEVVSDFWKGVSIRELALCGEHCPSGIRAGAFDVELCKEDLREGISHTRCSVENCRKKVPLQSLLIPPPMPMMVNELRDLMEARFDSSDTQAATISKKIDALGDQMAAFKQLVRDDIRAVLANMTDDAHDGPRLFSVKFMEPGFLNKPGWAATKLKVTLWCEHSHWPIPFHDDNVTEKGMYELDVPKQWLVKAGKWLKISGRLVLWIKTLGLAGDLPGVSKELERSVMDEADTAQKLADKLKADEEAFNVEEAIAISGLRPEPASLAERAYGEVLDKDDEFARWLRAQIRAKDSHFADMRKVTDITGKVLWVHPKFLEHYQKPLPRMS
ncbi:COR domain-containing protein [Prosthecobacter sp.]|uniref:leucine-rich repeat domain-containing protein n=1 Tax=Prosthecobacter sp. TaxID=1965333 RepID=UPI003784D3D3